MDKVSLSELRAKYPMYSDLNDDQFLIGFRKKFYGDIPPQRFYNMIDYDTQKVDPTEGMSTTDKLLAGAGKSFSDIGSSVQKLGAYVADFVSPRETKLSDLVTGNKPKSRVQELQEQIDEQQRLDKSLMDTTAGKVGKYGTDLALTFVPGLKGQQIITEGVKTGARVLPRAVQATTRAAAPYIGAAGSGAVLGAITSPEDMGSGAGAGALFGAGGELAGRVGTATWNGGKAILEPLTEGGRDRILRRTVERFAQNPAQVRAAAANPEVLVPGVTPTLAEATGDVGIAQLQRAAQTASPDVANALAEARARQVGGYRDVLDSLSGTDDLLAYATANRDKVAGVNYGKAFQADAAKRAAALDATKASAPFAGIGGEVPMADLATLGLRDLMQRPAFKQAAEQARVLARNKGVDIGNPIESLQGLHYIKLALDDMANPQAASALGRNASGAINEMRAALTKELESVAPTYGVARKAYADMSVPINQMEISRALRDKALPALTDMNPNLARINANSYAQALRNADQTVRNATGMKSMSMQEIMEPGQMRVLEGIGKDMGRYAATQEAGRVAGSPTAQYLGGQNVLRQALGPLGLSQGAMDSAMARMASGVLNLPYKFTESQTQQLLARVLTDPAVATKILATKDPKTIADILRPYAAQMAVQASID